MGYHRGGSQSFEFNSPMQSMHGTFMDASASFQSKDLKLDAYNCKLCNAILPTRADIQKHMNIFHKNDQALPYVCDICQKGFFSLSGLRHHKNAHNGYQHPCSVCDTKFQHRFTLYRHLKGVHGLKHCKNCSQLFPIDIVDAHTMSCYVVSKPFEVNK